ncbi:MAG: PRC-barrel domain-containing protein [Christensenellales bacterium]|jgi:uncharacterized protein YrrD
MIRSEDIRGREVIGAEGEKVGVAEAVVYSPDADYIRGIVFETVLLRRRKFVAHGDFELQGEQVILKKEAELLSPPDESQLFPAAMDKHMQEVGYISELYIDEDSGRVCALEIAASTFEDISSGRATARRFKAGKEGTKADYD